MTTVKKCQGCRDGAALDFNITVAFQPIVDMAKHRVFAYEAMVRGVDGEGTGAILSRVDDRNLYAFDQRCRVTAIERATEVGLSETGAYLSINFLPNAIYEPRACIRLTLDTARRTGFPTERILFEFTESERLDPDHLLNILTTYRQLGFKTATDDFGAGHSGLGLLARFQPDIVKLDMALVQGVAENAVQRTIVGHMVRMLQDLGIAIVAEGIETAGDFAVLRDMGITLMQGYLFARPGLTELPEVLWPE
ncbi:EAL domain-containing protein [Ovoidimarina sediminis]|uniref:EAL domain-containing protein n=1 Tax=Ovoidimarina sediminis TaxID=3079856 RepID=UPI002906C682|nr:EAL domain-containing protein [Rhodophyticola sp. MJ-SS7]MDU8942892.1 EAL domain-containing protein [Rhodophyticola sp. MJ-SS7]